MPRPYKKLFCDRKEVFQLPLVAFKVWMYHYCREGPDRKSWPSRESVCTDLGISLDALKDARKYLIGGGWLKIVGQIPGKDGHRSPIFRVARGEVVLNPRGRGGLKPPKGVGHGGLNHPNPRGLKPPIEVDSVKVDSLKEEVGEEMSFKKRISVICEQAGVKPDFKNSEVWQEIENLAAGQGSRNIETKLEEWLADNPDVQTCPVRAFLGGYKRVRTSGRPAGSENSQNVLKRILGLCAAKQYILSGKQKFELTSAFAEEPATEDIPFEIWKAGIEHIARSAQDLDNGKGFEIGQIPTRIANSLVPLILHDPDQKIINDYYSAKALPFLMEIVDKEGKLEADKRLAEAERRLQEEAAMIEDEL